MGIWVRDVVFVWDKPKTYLHMFALQITHASQVIQKGKATNKLWFKLASTIIPTIQEKPVKSLGKIFNSSMKDIGNAIENQWWPRHLVI